MDRRKYIGIPDSNHLKHKKAVNDFDPSPERAE